MRKPRIAIPEINQKLDNYRKALLEAGLDPVAVSLREEPLKEEACREFLDYSEFRAEDFDGLLLPGGGDIHPSRFGQEDCGSRNISEKLDELQLNVMDAFVKAGKPILGICRGIQVINVYFGGDLIQDLPDASFHIGREDEPDRIHACTAEEGSWLAKLYGTAFVHNSIHHQAVGRLGEGLIADGICPEDGVVEALHHRTLPVYGLQWHPERMCMDCKRADTVDGLPVIQFFADQIKA